MSLFRSRHNYRQVLPIYAIFHQTCGRRIMAFYRLLIFVACATVARCEDNCVFDLKRGNKHFQFDLTYFEGIQTVNFTESTGFYSINIKLCKSDEQESKCDGIRSKLCLIKDKKNEIDIGSKIKEVKLDGKDQLIMSLEGNTVCETDQKYTTDIICICNKNTLEEKIVYKSGVGICKYIIELISVAVCPVDDLDIRRVCDVSIHHNRYKFNLNPLRRLTNNYLVENRGRRFEVNICGRLTDNNRCGSNNSTICDVTNIAVPKQYAVGYSKNDRLLFNDSSKHLIIIQHEKATKNKKGRKIEFTFKCDENIPPAKTKPEFIYEGKINEQSANVLYFEVATATVCIPRMTSCEIFTNMNNFNLKPLHKRVGNRIVTNEKDGGYFYLNVCDYLNQYDEKIPSSCTDGKTSVCYVDKWGRGIPVGSHQIGPYVVENSILLNYTDGEDCKNALKWSTVINFTCSEESQLKHDSTNLTTCTHLFQWKTHKACNVLFERKDKCLVTHPHSSETVYNMSNLKDYSFEVTDDEDDAKFRFSICSPLQTPCNGYLDSSACWSYNGMEKNIGMFTDQVVFDNGTIYMSMKGEKCVNSGPNSYTTVRFMCDYLDSKLIDFKKDLRACTFDFIIHTKHACTPPSKINCTVEDKLGNVVYDLSKLTKLNTNYEIPFGYKKKIVLNVCHSVINNGYSMYNNIDGINCQFKSGICLVDSNSLISSNWYQNLGDVNEGPHRDKDTIKLEMINGFYNNHKISSVIEFLCSNHTEGPVLLNDEDNVYKFRWLTPLACPISRQKQKKELLHDVNPITNYVLDGLGIYSIYVCSKNDIDRNCNLDTYSDDDHHSKLGQQIILIVNKEKKKYTLGINSYFVYNSNKTCDEKKNNSQQVLFKFICGFEHQRPKVIYKEMCKTKVLIIDPKICDKKLECSVNSYDLTPIKGHYIVNDNGIKYYINMCVPGINGVGVLMELNGKNYTIGYQSQLPKQSEGSDRVEVVFTDGDYCIDCLEQTKIKYITKIIFECDNSVHLGKAIFVTAKNGKFQFLWKTSFVCSNNKLIEFDKNACSVNSEDFVDSNIINMKNILNTKQFYDDLKNINYHVDFCTASVCLKNTSEILECFGNMNLQYNVYKNQLIATFKDINGFTKVKMIIECIKSTENLSNTNKVLLTDNGEIIINTYSEVMCRNYLLIPISTTTFKTTSYIVNELSTKFEYYDFQNSNLEIPTLLNEESDQEPTIRNVNTHVQQERGEKAENSVNKITMEKEVSSSLFYSDNMNNCANGYSANIFDVDFPMEVTEGNKKTVLLQKFGELYSHHNGSKYYNGL